MPDDTDSNLSAAQFGLTGDMGSSGDPSAMGAGNPSGAATAPAAAPWMSDQ